MTKTEFPLTRDEKPVSRCKVCGGGAELFDVVDFNKFCGSNPYFFGLSGEAVYYLRCLECGFIFTTHFDDWSKEQFEERIYNSDYFKIDGEYLEIRPKREAERFVKSVPDAAHLSILDFGSGTGGFSKHAATHGFTNISNYDPFSTPERPKGHFDLATAFEVLEHTPTPLRTFADIFAFLKHDCAVLFTTMFQPPDISEVRAKHWYIGPRNGHVSIYNRRSLCRLADLLGVRFTMDERYHVLSRGNPPIRLNSDPALLIDLRAPTAVQSKGWSGLERRYRWTTESSICWEIFVPHDATVIFTIPFVSEAAPSFSERCRLDCANTSKPMTKSAGQYDFELTAHLRVPKGKHTVTLTTPDPVRPLDLGTSLDSRHLGLFVRCE